jgi:hypothetical protein
MLGLIAVAAAADTLHAIGIRPPHKPTAAVVAILPWALVLIGFGLLLCLLRQARLRQAAADEAGLPEPSGQAEAATGLDALFGPKRSGVPQKPGPQGPGPRDPGLRDPGPKESGLREPRPQESGVAQEPAGANESPAEAAGTAVAPEPPAAEQSPAEATEAAGAEAPVAAEAQPTPDSTVDLAIDTEPGQDDPASDEGSTWTPGIREQEPAGVGGPGHNGGSPPAFSPAPTVPLIEAGTHDRG